MKTLLLGSILIFLQASLFGQVRIEPVPKCGWDSLNSMIQYPEIALRSGYRTALLANIAIDSLGTMTHISIEPFSTALSRDLICPLNQLDSLFITAIKNILHNVEWYPGSVDGIKKSIAFEMPFVFHFYPFGTPQSHRRMMIVDIIRPRVQTHRTQ